MNRFIVASIALLTLVSACRVHDARINPPPPIDVPDTYRHEAGDAPPSVRWWEDFEDEELNATIEQALGGNLDLRGAWARLAQAAAIARQQSSAMMPQVEAGMGMARQRVHTQEIDTSSIDVSQGLDDLSIQSRTVAREVDNFHVNVSVGWEIDLWGRVASLENASLKDRLAGREDLSAIAVIVAAQVADTWFMLAEQAQLMDVLESQLATNKALLKLVELRFTQGLVHAVDVRQQRQQLSAVEAEMPLIHARHEVLRSQLAVL
ncbi:MAG: TolC family protein, partial [Myxococcota bacterium]|nr:TolC family protein [Myxococcota bacterium]